MLKLFDSLRGIGFWAVLFRMAVACLCGTLIGLERSTKNRPAGFRTHILVCMGSAAASVTALYLYLGLKLPSDISRIGAQAMSGLGFIVAGTIIITRKMSIKGLTTAAGLWTTGIIGLAIGTGYCEIALVATALVLLTETWFARLGAAIQQRPEYSIELLYNEKNALDHVLRLCKDNRMAITNLKIQKLSDSADAQYSAQVELRGAMRSEVLIARIRTSPGVYDAMAL